MQEDHISPAIDRAYRIYSQYIWSPTVDSLYNLLTALHSLDDKVNDVHGRILLDIPEYVVLKALRNYFHHEAELRNTIQVNFLPGVMIASELMHICLVSALDCSKAIQSTNKTYRASTESAFAETTRNYGDVIDIQPCIFNCMVKILQGLRNHGLSGSSEEFSKFEEAYDLDILRGINPYVSGGIATHAADVDKARNLLSELYKAS